MKHIIIIVSLVVFAALKRSKKKDTSTIEIDSSSLVESFEDSKAVFDSLSTQTKPANKHKQLFDLEGKLRRKYGLIAVSVDPHLSLVCSPLAALLPLGLLALGAEGQIEKELAIAIGFDEERISRSKHTHNLQDTGVLADHIHVSPKDRQKNWVRFQFKALLRDVSDLNGLFIASKMFLAGRHKLLGPFENDVKSVFESRIEIGSVLMKNPVTVASTVNYWVKQKTNGLISDVIKSTDLSRDTSLLLVNAIYFRDTWLYPFTSTRYETFYGASGEKSVPMMHVKGQYKFGRSKVFDATIVEIPFSKNRGMMPVQNKFTYKGAVMIAILPNNKKGLPLLLNQLRLSPRLLDGILSVIFKQPVDLSIPKFKMESKVDLGQIYKKIGLRNMFTNKSGLTSMVMGEAVHFSDGIQNAVIEVTENGTTAAAKKVLKRQRQKSSTPKPIEEFKADHPFIFFILYSRQQLFTGVFNY